MYDGRLVTMEVIQPASDVTHNLEDLVEARRGHVADVIEEVSVGADLRNNHDRHIFGILRDADANESDNVLVAKVAQDPELFQIHLGQVASNVGDGDRRPFVDAAVDVFETAATDPFETLEGRRCDLAVLKIKALEVELTNLAVGGRRSLGRRSLGLVRSLRVARLQEERSRAVRRDGPFDGACGTYRARVAVNGVGRRRGTVGLGFRSRPEGRVGLVDGIALRHRSAVHRKVSKECLTHPMRASTKSFFVPAASISCSSQSLTRTSRRSR